MAFKDAIYAGDIGCYTLGINLKALDTCICMGASISFSEDLKRANGNKVVVGIIGDSTFFHTGIPPLINAYVNSVPVVICILDNMTTAMTGFQKVAHEEDVELIERLVKAIGINFIKVIDPFNISEATNMLKDAHDFSNNCKKPTVVIFRRSCVLKEKTMFNRYVEITDKCINCGRCYKLFGCPAIMCKDSVVSIDKNLCINCGLCTSICPEGAIVEI
jgi:indolepyruvate ferredoxin oxidoreductase alpha subunit